MKAMFRSIKPWFAGMMVFGVVSGACAQETEIAPDLQCLRFLQAYERALRIPQGLLTAVSLVETGRAVGARSQLSPWPWTINVNGQGKFFETKDEAVAETRKLIDEGQRSVDIGCMQVNLRYHPNAFKSLDEAFDPAANTAYGAQFLNSLHAAQGSWDKAIERYHSSDDNRREAYREKVLSLWNGDVRTMVMDAVLAENTDTPYHHAMRDFADAKYDDALLKYLDILRSNPRDRLGLLGVAMSYEKLGRDVDSDAAYGRYLAVAPEDESALASVISKARTLPADRARSVLEALAEAGVQRSELFAAMAEIAGTAGDTDAAFKYASQAAERSPGMAVYTLNAGVLADRLKRPAIAVKYYEDFLALTERMPITTTASLDGIRDRVRFLRARL